MLKQQYNYVISYLATLVGGTFTLRVQPLIVQRPWHQNYNMTAPKTCHFGFNVEQRKNIGRFINVYSLDSPDFT